jgi:hypothetical protein
MRNFARFMTFFAMAFAFGGFLFYASVVVPIGTQIVGSTTQGFVTRHVTDVLNWATLATVVMVIWEAALGGYPRGRRRLLFGCAIVIVVCLISLFWLHELLEDEMLEGEFGVEDERRFYSLHRVYLWLSTLQWIASLPIWWILVTSQTNNASTPLVPLNARPNPSNSR